MKLMVEMRLVIVSTDADGVIIQPEYWWEGQLIERLPSRKVQPGEELIYGPHMSEVEFNPPVVGGH
jgi:hypothetical protein